MAWTLKFVTSFVFMVVAIPILCGMAYILGLEHGATKIVLNEPALKELLEKNNELLNKDINVRKLLIEEIQKTEEPNGKRGQRRYNIDAIPIERRNRPDIKR